MTKLKRIHFMRVDENTHGLVLPDWELAVRGLSEPVATLTCPSAACMRMASFGMLIFGTFLLLGGRRDRIASWDRGPL